MKLFAKLALAIGLLAGSAVATTEPASAQVGFSVEFGDSSPYYGYEYSRPCRWYFNHDYPAPRRCYRDYYGYYGSGVYISDGFVFRNRSHWNRYRYRDDYRHWRSHDWNRHVSHDRNRGRGDRWDRHDRGGRDRGNRHDRGGRDRHDRGGRDRHDGGHRNHH